MLGKLPNKTREATLITGIDSKSAALGESNVVSSV